MKNRIAADFGALPITESEEQTLFLNVDKVFYKFVWLDQSKGYSQLEQFYLLRYELASTLKSHYDSKSEESEFTLTSGELIRFFGRGKTLEVYLKPHLSSIVFNIPVSSDLVINILSDLEKLAAIRSEASNNSIETLLKDLVENKSHLKKLSESFTTADLEFVLFEKAILVERGGNDLTSLYRFALNEDLSDPSELSFSLLEYFENIYNIESCECGKDSCFFDMLKANKQHFLNSDYLTQEGDFENSKVEADFKKLWENLTINKKAALKYLYNEFRNTTLLNLAFIKPQFDLMDYQYLMCYPYQPDSEDQDWVMEVSTLANFVVQNG